MPKLKPNENIWIWALGERFQVTGIFQSVDKTNDHCRKNRDVGVIAVAGGFIFVARKTKSTAPQVFY